MNFIPQKYRFHIVGAVIGLVISSASLNAQNATNLLSNGGFENWQEAINPESSVILAPSAMVPVNWLPLVQPASVTQRPTLAQDTLIKHGGQFSVRIEMPPGIRSVVGIRSEGADWWAPSPIQVAPGKTYKIRGWVRGENLQPDSNGKTLEGNLIVGESGDFFGGHNNNRQMIFPIQCQGSTEWMPFEFQFETSAKEEKAYLELIITGAGKVWMDDFEMTLVP